MHSNFGSLIILSDSEHEEIEVLELPFSEALEMIQNQEIIDAKTIMLLQYAQINKLLGCKN